jgi:hypothetical protein
MANQVQDTANYIQPFCRYQVANIGTNNMPMIGIVNIVRNIMLAAPFTWRFNRKLFTMIGPQGLVLGQQDYSVSVTDLGFIENVVVTDPTVTIGTNTWSLKDVYNNIALPVSNTQSRPEAVSIHSDDGAGNLVLRFSPVPNKAYNVAITYQKAPVQFAVMSDPWAPIPDSFTDVYNNLCLGYFMDSCQDPRAKEYIARGIAGLLARSQGLSQMDKILFAASYMNMSAQQLLNMLEAQQGVQAKGAR